MGCMLHVGIYRDRYELYGAALSLTSVGRGCPAHLRRCFTTLHTLSEIMLGGAYAWLYSLSTELMAQECMVYLTQKSKSSFWQLLLLLCATKNK